MRQSGQQHIQSAEKMIQKWLAQLRECFDIIFKIHSRKSAHYELNPPGIEWKKLPGLRRFQKPFSQHSESSELILR